MAWKAPMFMSFVAMTQNNSNERVQPRSAEKLLDGGHFSAVRPPVKISVKYSE